MFRLVLRWSIVVVIFAFIAWSGRMLTALGDDVQEQKKARAYVGVKKCSLCHRSEKTGNQYGKWLKTGHSDAYNTLGTPEAREIATKLGLTEDPQKSSKCLRCHVTAFGEDAELVKALKPEDGIQCESCHGAGQDYNSRVVMKDKNEAIARGLVMPTKEVCLKCHNEDSPSYKEFDFEERCKKIAHQIPKESKE